MIPVRESIYPRFPGGRTKVFTLSFDDGVEQDIRLVSMMKTHGVTGTFNLNSGLFRGKDAPYSHPLIRRLPQHEILRLFQDSGMEIAVHGYQHPDWTELPPETALYDILEDRKNLEKLFRKPIRGCAYPYGAFNDTVLGQLRAAGILYARTVFETEAFSLPKNWLTLNPTCHYANKDLETLTNEFLNKKTAKMPEMFYVWGHSYEFEAMNNWDVMERLLDQIAGRQDIWYASNIEIYNCIHTYRQLDFSLEANSVRNPSSISVWIQKAEQIIEIPAGKTIEI